jgi:hypothetical protein
MDAVARMRAGGPRPPDAMPPTLASAFLAEGHDYDEQPWETQCRFQQWWLRNSVDQGSPPAAALNAFRYGTMITAIRRLGSSIEAQEPEATAAAAAAAAAKGLPPYPGLARWFDVSGATTIRRRLDAAGKPERARVIQRDIKVRGIRDLRPIAFEDTFDALAVKYGLAAKVAAKPADKNADVLRMVWTLDTDAHAPKPAQQPPAGAK